MKVLRIVLIVVGILFILIAILMLFNAGSPERSDAAFVIGYYTAKFIFFVFGFGMLMLARRIKMKMNKKETNTLIDSLPS